MRYELVFQISTAAGIQLRAVQRLKQIGILTTNRSFRDGPNGERYLVLQVQGAQVTSETIWKQVAEIQGILSLVENPFAKPEAEQAVKKPAVPEFVPESGDAAIRDRMLIFSLLSRYPKVDGRFNEILTAIPPENRRVRALELGFGFGGYLARQVKPKKAPTKLADSMTELLIPALSPMASLQLDGNDLAIGSNHIDLKGRGHIAETCDFIKGTVNGLLSTYALSPLFVGHTCRHDSGGETCRFMFAPKLAA